MTLSSSWSLSTLCAVSPDIQGPGIKQYSQSGKQPYFRLQKPLNIFADFGHFSDYLPLRTGVHKEGLKL